MQGANNTNKIPSLIKGSLGIKIDNIPTNSGITTKLAMTKATINRL